MASIVDCSARVGISYSGISLSSLWSAVKKGDLSEIETLLTFRMDLGAQDASGNSLLHIAAKRGDLEIVEALIEARAPSNLLNGIGLTPLEMAATQFIIGDATRKLRQIKIMQILMAENTCSERSVFKQLIFLNNAPAVAMLIEAGANIAHVDGLGETALHHATRVGSGEMVRLLLRAHANVNVADRRGLTPLHVAVQSTHETVVHELLCAEGINVSLEDTEKKTPLHLASEMGASGAVEKLILAGAAAYTPDRHGRTALHYAAQKGHLSTVKLLAPKANLFALSALRKTALIEAAEENHVEVVTHLLPLYTALKRDKDVYLSPLIQATIHGLPSAVSLFLKCDPEIDLEERDRYGLKALQVAAVMLDVTRNKIGLYKKIILILTEFARKRASVEDTELIAKDELIPGILNQDIHLVRGLLAAGIDPRSDEKLKPLKMAALAGYVEIVQVLLSASPKMDDEGYLLISEALRSHNTDLFMTLFRAGYRLGERVLSPFQVVAYFHCPSEIVKHLLEIGIDVNADYKGAKLLHTAIRQGHPLIVQRLIDAGADVNAADARGKRPLFDAVQVNNASIINMLLAKGAQIEVINAEGETPLILAVRLYCFAAAEALLAAGANKKAKNAAGHSAYMLSLPHRNPSLSAKLA